MENVFGKNEFENTREVPASPEELESFVESVGPKLKEVTEQMDNIEDLEQRGVSEKVKEALVSAKKAVGKVMKFTFTRLLPVYMAYIGAGHFMQKEDGKFSEKDRARKELQEKGITSEQASAYKLGISDLVYRGVTPMWSTTGGVNLNKMGLVLVSDVVPNLIEKREIRLNYEETIHIEGNDYKKGDLLKSSEDAWRLYLGLPQKDDTFGISDYQPTKAKSDKFYIRVKSYVGALKEVLRTNEKYSDCSTYQEALLQFVGDIQARGGKVVTQGIGAPEISYANDGKASAQESDLALMFGTYTISLGSDEKGNFISYYDIWDFDVPTEQSGRGLGRAFEIYDRIYYNPETGEIIDELLSK